MSEGTGLLVVSHLYGYWRSSDGRLELIISEDLVVVHASQSEENRVPTVHLRSPWELGRKGRLPCIIASPFRNWASEDCDYYLYVARPREDGESDHLWQPPRDDTPRAQIRLLPEQGTAGHQHMLGRWDDSVEAAYEAASSWMLPYAPFEPVSSWGEG